MAAQQQQQPDSSYDLVYVAVFFAIVSWVTWKFLHEKIVYVVFKIKLFEASIVDLVTNNLDYNLILLKTLDPADVSLEGLYELANDVGMYFRFPIIIIIGILAYILISRSVTDKYKTAYSMKSLSQAETINWPQITPVVHLDLVSQDIMKGPWAMSDTPMEFCKRYKLIDVTLHDNVGLQRKFPTVVLRKGIARQKFVEQLGPLWTGVDNIPMHANSLFAIFSCRINQNRKDADKLIRQLAISSGTSEMDYTGVEDIIKRYIDSKIVKRVLSRHAYYLTVMPSMVLAAREDGVVASADFIWLKPVDRRLWYMMNTMGRQTPFTEVCGPFAHWIAESTYGRKIKTAMVDTAVDALEFALTEMAYIPDEDES